MASELVEALMPVVAVLDQLNVRYCVGGSVASSFHGAARSTLDVDVAAELDQATALRMIEALQEDYYVSKDAVTFAVRERSCFNLVHYATSFKVDIFVSRGRDFDRSVQDRAITATLDADEALSARIASAEDVILNKLEWYRLGNEVSERQWNDVSAVARIQSDRLDHAYLRHWAGRLGVSDLLERLSSELDPGGGSASAR